MGPTFEYMILSYDPIDTDGQWRDTDACAEKITSAAELGWIVTQTWERTETGVWFFLMVRERP